MEKRAYIVLGGEIDSMWLSGILREKRSEDLLVGADRGGKVLFDLGIFPDILMGDFDSFGIPRKPCPEETKKNRKTEIITFPPEKDFSDGELAAAHVYEMGFRQILLLGGFGGRQDHFLSHLFLLAHYYRKGANLTLLDPSNKIYVAKGRARIEKKNQWGKYISFFPLEGSIHDFSITGVKYPLSKKTLDPIFRPSLALSNEITEETALLTWEDGLLLILETGEGHIS